MYNDLYEAWKREIENLDLERLPADFYSRTAKYLKKLRQEGRMIDKRTVKAKLIKREMLNAKRMIHELSQARYRKLLNKASVGEKIPSDFLTTEEKKMYTKVVPLAETFQRFAKNILRGQALELSFEQKHGKAVLRLSKNVPAIIGVDMKTYGPFKVEDVASLPIENSRILVKQRLAKRLEF